MFIEGVASSLDEWEAAQHVAKEYPYVILIGTLQPFVIEQEFAEASAALVQHGFTRVKWVRVGESLTLEGEVFEEDRPKLSALEKEWRPRLELTVSRPKPKPKPKAR